MGTALFKYESSRSFLGDGYSLSVYELPPSIHRRFESADQKLLTEYPKVPSHWSNLKFEHWREAPFDSALQAHLDFALSYDEPDSGPSLAVQIEAIRKSLARKRTYYAFSKNEQGEYIGDIDFFIVDLVERRLYMINFSA